VWACSVPVPPKFAEHKARAEAAAARGDHEEAAQQWALASQFADIERSRDEATYRQATSLQRAGRDDEAKVVLRKLAATDGSRQERAAYDLATSALLATPSDEGAQLERTLVQFPSSGLARGALERWLRRLTPAQRLVVLERLASKISDAALNERFLLQQARNHEALGQWSQALERYTSLADRYPYPSGQYWDEALLGKAALHARSGDLGLARQTLRHMLSYREIATIVGTYERRYTVASLMLAKFTASDDWRAAHTLLLDFPESYPTSRELDEALWAAALLARDNGDEELACADAEVLRQVDSSSRYASCSALVCDAEAQQASSPEPACRRYVAEKRSTFEAVIVNACTPYLRVNEHDGAFERQ
jgi:hypothetical protein